MTYNINNSGAARRPPQFAFLHLEGAAGFLHIRVLGEGIQGTASLVRDCSTGALVVRKRTAAIPLSDDPFADQFAISHPHIIQLLGAQNYREGNDRWASATYWPYANDDSLKRLCERFRERGMPVPEVIVWQALCHMLKGHAALWAAGRSHRDAHAANVFVHWDGISHLPTFILGDLGLCEVLPGTYLAGEDDEGELDPNMPGFAARVSVSNAQLDAVLGEPTMQQVYDFDESEASAMVAGTGMEQFWFPKALTYFGKDISDVSECLSVMMHGLEFDETEIYSSELNQFAQMLYNVNYYGTSMYVRTMLRWELMFAQVRLAAETGLANAIGRTNLPVPGGELLGPGNVDGRPVLFDSVQALHACDMRPPGPWYVAAVDPDTLQVLEVDQSRAFCAQDWLYTDSRGKQISLHPPHSSESDSSGSPPKQDSPFHRHG